MRIMSRNVTATCLSRKAMEERRQWEETHPRLQDSRFLVLSAMTIEAGKSANCA